MRRRKSVQSAGKTAEEVASSALLSTSITHMEVKMQVLSAQMQHSWSSHLQLFISSLNLVEPTYGFSLSVKITEEPDSVSTADTTSKHTNWLHDPLQFSFKRKQKKSAESTKDSNDENIDAGSSDTQNQNDNAKLFSSSDIVLLKPSKQSPLLATFSDPVPLTTKYLVSLTPKNKHDNGLMHLFLGSKPAEHQKLNSRNLELKLAATVVVPGTASRIQLLVSPVDLAPYVQQLMLLKHAKVAKTKPSSSKNNSKNESSMDVEILIPFDLPDYVLNCSAPGRKNLFGYPKPQQQLNDQIKPDTMSTFRVRLQLQLVSLQQQQPTMNSYSSVVRARANLQPLAALSLARSMGMRKLNSSSVETDNTLPDGEKSGATRTTSQASENKDSQNILPDSPTPAGYFSPPVFANPSPLPNSNSDHDRESLLAVDVNVPDQGVDSSSAVEKDPRLGSNAESRSCDYSLDSHSSATVPNDCRQRSVNISKNEFELTKSISSGGEFTSLMSSVGFDLQIFLGRGESLDSNGVSRNSATIDNSLQHPSGSSLSAGTCSGDSDESNSSATVVHPDGSAPVARIRKQSQQTMVTSEEIGAAKEAPDNQGSCVSLSYTSPMADSRAESHSQVLSSSLSFSPTPVPTLPDPASNEDDSVKETPASDEVAAPAPAILEEANMSINAKSYDSTMQFSRSSSMLLSAPNGLAWFAESLSPHSSPPSQMVLNSSSNSSPSRFLHQYVTAISASKPGKTVQQDKCVHPDPVSPSPGPWPAHSPFKSRFNRILGSATKSLTSPLTSKVDVTSPSLTSPVTKDEESSPVLAADDADKENIKRDMNIKKIKSSPSMHTPLSSKKLAGANEENRRMSPSVQLVLELSRQLDQALQDRIEMEKALQMKELRMDQMQAQLNRFEDRIIKLESFIPTNEL
eukprot:gene29717-38852_t